MLTAFEQVTRDAMDLPLRQKLALAESLLESAESAADPQAEAAWDSEILDRVRAIDEGRVTGISYEDVMKAAEKHLLRVHLVFEPASQSAVGLPVIAHAARKPLNWISRRNKIA